MTHQIRAELLKIRSTRSAVWFLLTQTAVVLLSVIAQGLSQSVTDLSGADAQRTLLGTSTTAVAFAAFIGLLAVTSEHRYGTIRSTLVFEPRRRIVLGAKLVASAVTGAVFGAAGVGTAFGAGLVLLSDRNVDLALDGGHLTLIAAGTVAGSVFWSMLGVGVGTLVRHQVGAIVALVAWTSVVESVLFAFVPSIGRYLPGEAGNGLADLPTAHLVSPAVGAAVLGAWALALAVAGRARLEHTDVD